MRPLFSSTTLRYSAALGARLKTLLAYPVVVLLLVAHASLRQVQAEPAHFWLSTSNTSTTGPAVPSISIANNSLQQLYIWAQPATTNSGLYNASSNPYQVLQRFSLNLVSLQPNIDFLDGQIAVYNPLSGTTPRFASVNDSTNTGATPPLVSAATEQDVLGGTADRIAGIEGFSLLNSEGTGFGSTCASDPFCKTTPSGAPAWLVASVGYRMVHFDSTTEIYLQIGSNGISHMFQTSAETKVVFGAGSAPVYTAGRYIDDAFVLQRYGDRDKTLSGDTADFIVKPSLPGDFNGDSVVNSADYVAWRSSDGTPTGYATWRSHFGTSATGAGQLAAAVPEPNTLSIALLGVCFILAAARRRTVTPHRNRARFLAARLLALACLSASRAEAFVLTSGNSSLTVDPTTQAGAHSWNVVGFDPAMLVQQWYWFRVGSSGPEASVNSLPLVGPPTVDPVSPNVGVIEYAGAGVDIQITYGLTGDTDASHLSAIGNPVRVRNLTSSPIDFHLFQYAKLDLGQGTGNDNVEIGSDYVGFGGSAGAIEKLDAPTPNHRQAGHTPDLLTSLNDANPTTLDDGQSGSFGNADFALQWDTTLLPGVDFKINTDLNTLPLPGAGGSADMSDDGPLDQLDVDLFTLALKSRDAYFNSKRANNLCLCLEPEERGDMNNDGRFDFDDVQGFMTKLRRFGSGSISYDSLTKLRDETVPEPATVFLAIPAVVALGVRKRRK